MANGIYYIARCSIEGLNCRYACMSFYDGHIRIHISRKKCCLYTIPVYIRHMYHI